MARIVFEIDDDPDNVAQAQEFVQKINLRTDLGFGEAAIRLKHPEAMAWVRSGKVETDHLKE